MSFCDDCPFSIPGIVMKIDRNVFSFPNVLIGERFDFVWFLSFLFMNVTCITIFKIRGYTYIKNMDVETWSKKVTTQAIFVFVHKEFLIVVHSELNIEVKSNEIKYILHIIDLTAT